MKLLPVHRALFVTALVSAALAGLFVPSLVAAQKPAPADDQDQPIRVDVDLVNVLFSVRTKKGELVPNLNKEDFAVYEDGKEQTIKAFTRESDLPLTLGLLVDVSASQQNLIEIERDAASSFFASVLRKKDMAFLIGFGHETQLLQDFTGSPRILQAALKDLRPDSGGSGTVINPGAIPQYGTPKGTLLYDAIYLASNEKLSQEVGRKALVLITDGADQGSFYKRDQAVEASQKADAMVYSIYYVDPYFYAQAGGFGGGDEGGLRKMSDETGGHVFRVDKKHTLHDIFQALQEEMRNQYSIGYTSTNPTKDGTFRKLEIRSKNKDLKVQARKGYYATKHDAP